MKKNIKKWEIEPIFMACGNFSKKWETSWELSFPLKREVLTTRHVFVRDKLPYEKGETANLWSDGRNAESIEQQEAGSWRWEDSEREQAMGLYSIWGSKPADRKGY